MGKKYEAWQEAKQEYIQANNHAAVACGGSTGQAFKEAVANQERASAKEYNTYRDFRDDPTG